MLKLNKMMKEKLKNIFEKFKQNQRYFWVILVLILVFLINQSFPAEKITTESCKGGKCKTVIEDPSLSDEDTSYYVNDVFTAKKGEFYRIIFEARTNQNTALTVSAANLFDQNKEIEKITLDNKNSHLIKEVIFASDSNYTDLLFQKNNPGDGADIIISQLRVSKLNIANEKELPALAPTFIGDIDLAVADQLQEKNDYSFRQLKEPDVLFGQIFKPEFSFITNVLLDIDLVKQGNGGGKKYALELREIGTDSDLPKIKSDPLAILSFSMDGIEKYRQENGKFLFPIVAKLDKEKSYFIGINNDSAEINNFNYLILKGSTDKNSYKNGVAAVKYKSYSYLAQGDLYFKTYGFELKKYEGIPILYGSIIEDRGKGQSFFTFQSLENEYDLINLNSASKDISFNDGFLNGKIDEKENSYLIYKFNTIYPFKNFSLSASQGDSEWNKIKIFYSFDEEIWQEISDLKKEDLQVFGYFQNKIPDNQKEIYIKIEPQKDKYPEQDKFGIKDFKFQAELINKK